MEFNNNKPIYLQLVDYFLEKILRKEILPGDKIMSVRRLAELAQVTPNTASRAYAYMQQLGIVYNKRGIGLFVSESAYEKAKMINKTEFIEKDLPKFFNTLDMLNIDFKELEKLYNNQKNKML